MKYTIQVRRRGWLQVSYFDHLLIEGIAPQPVLVDLHGPHVPEQIEPRDFVVEPRFDGIGLGSPEEPQGAPHC